MSRQRSKTKKGSLLTSSVSSLLASSWKTAGPSPTTTSRRSPPFTWSSVSEVVCRSLSRPSLVKPLLWRLNHLTPLRMSRPRFKTKKVSLLISSVSSLLASNLRMEGPSLITTSKRSPPFTGFYFKSDGFASEGLDKDLHATTETKDQVKGGLLLDVVIREGPSILKLLASKDETLLIRRDAFFVLNLGLDILNGVRWFNLQSNGFTSEGLDKDLHTTSETEDQVKGGLLLDVVVGEGPAVFQLLASKDQPLLIRGDTFLVLDLGLDILNGVRWLNFQCNGLASEGLDEDLHATSQPKNQVQSGLLLDVVVREGPTILKLLASEDQPLLVGWDTLLV